MSRRIHPQSTPTRNVHLHARSTSWKLWFVLLLLIVLAIPTFYYGFRVGNRVIPSMTQLFYDMSGPAPLPTPTPHPALTTALPQLGTLLYTVQVGDSCDSILTSQMSMSKAGEIFSDTKPEAVHALDEAEGRDCHTLNQGMVLPLSPQYPLIALSGLVLKVEAASSAEALPTPLINITAQAQSTADCSNACLLTIRIAPQVQVGLQVQTTLPIHIGSWIWAQAMLTRKVVTAFDDYPYVDPRVPLNGMSLRACDFQVDNTHDNNSSLCDQLMPNTIKSDGGAWLFGVTGPSSLDHWHYPLSVPPGTPVLIWLSADNDTLKFDSGNPVYRYDDAKHVYVKA